MTDIERIIKALENKEPGEIRDYMRDLEKDDPDAAKLINNELLLPLIAKNDKGWVGLQAFYELVMGMKPPAHVINWMMARERAQEQGKRGIMLKAFRGATKSTTFSYLAPLFDLGHNPMSSTLIIRIKDKVAHKLTENMGRVITGPAWKKVFSHVVPHEGDKGTMKRSGGWGAAGYNVRDNRMSASEFDFKKGQETIDPSFLGVGIGSGEIIGKHPTGMLVVDDVHNRDNTESQIELERIKDIFVADVFPTIVPRKTFVSWAYTPWVEHDAYALAEATNQYLEVVTPAFVELEEGETGGIRYDGEFLTLKNAKLTWPEVYNGEQLEIKLLESGEKDFARMYQLDLEKAKGIYLKREWLGEYPAGELLKNFPVVFGVDYASVKDRRPKEQFNYFSVSIGYKLPMGGVVLVDGLRAHLSQAEAEQKLMGLARAWNPRMIGVEDAGTGAEFIKLLRRNTNLPIMPFTTRNRGKAERFETEMAPLFQFNRAYISSHHTPFINLFINAWVSWDRTETTPDDELDSTYYMLRAGADKLMGSYDPVAASLPGLKTSKELGITTIGSGRQPHLGRR